MRILSPRKNASVRAILAGEDFTELVQCFPATFCHPMAQHCSHTKEEKLAVVLHFLLCLKAKFPVIQALQPILQQFPGHANHPDPVCFGKSKAVEAAVFSNIGKQRLKAALMRVEPSSIPRTVFSKSIILISTPGPLSAIPLPASRASCPRRYGRIQCPSSGPSRASARR